MKKHTIRIDDIPVEPEDFTRGQVAPTQDKIYEYIKNHPDCTRKDLYLLDSNEGHVRRSITAMLKSNRVKETFTIVQ